MTTDPKPARAGPTTWPSLIAQLGPSYADDIDTFDALPRRIATTAPPAFAGTRLAGVDSSAAALAVLVGPDAAAPLFTIVAPSLSRIVRELLPASAPAANLAALHTLAFLNAAECCGAPASPDGDRLAELWLPRLAERAHTLTERERHTLAIAAAAASLPSLTPLFADTGELPDDFVAMETHGFNVPAFASYVANAVARGASYQDVEPAWLDFVHRFPFKLEAGTLDWPALMWGARAVYANLGELPENEVASELHRLVAGA